MINIEKVSIEQLQFHRVAHSIPSGEHLYHGRMVRDTKFIEEYKTPVGTFLPEEWCEVAKRVVDAAGLTEIYGAVREHCQKHCAWLKTEEELTEYVLSCMTTHAYEHWDGFKNERETELSFDGIQMELSDFMEVLP